MTNNTETQDSIRVFVVVVVVVDGPYSRILLFSTSFELRFLFLFFDICLSCFIINRQTTLQMCLCVAHTIHVYTFINLWKQPIFWFDVEYVQWRECIFFFLALDDNTAYRVWCWNFEKIFFWEKWKIFFHFSSILCFNNF